MTLFDLNSLNQNRYIKDRQAIIATYEKQLIKKEKSFKKLALLLEDFDNYTPYRRKRLAELKGSIQVLKNNISFNKDMLAVLQ
ncbi:hypothetical protein UFOVP338_68 [uncultured Caudovirales phage]|uniref:Uncharacterized protein n=1 Tax=uncultured Caudovirales phage TaxID=2100421 RepID=A0A6J5M726_9CAUD|nr:hypothetical protein UFOVP338_68 [uncultured Caudovirales phage]